VFEVVLQEQVKLVEEAIKDRNLEQVVLFRWVSKVVKCLYKEDFQKLVLAHE
jgi:hypothetical protein